MTLPTKLTPMPCWPPPGTASTSSIPRSITGINGRSAPLAQRCVSLAREEIVVCTKAGFLTPGAMPASGCASRTCSRACTPWRRHFLADQIDRSRANLGVDTIDVFYLHNPETQLAGTHSGGVRCGHSAGVRGARAIGDRAARFAGTAPPRGTDSGQKGAARASHVWRRSLARKAAPGHHFRFIQLPFNIGMVEAYTARHDNVLTAAASLGIAVVASASLSQTRVLREMPASVAALMPGLTANAQRAIQFTRSTPGISVALVGMGQREHVLENIGVAAVPPLDREELRAALPAMNTIEIGDDLTQLDAAIESLPNSSGGVFALARRGRAVPFEDQSAAAPAGAPAEGARTAVAAPQSRAIPRDGSNTASQARHSNRRWCCTSRPAAISRALISI